MENHYRCYYYSSHCWRWDLLLAKFKDFISNSNSGEARCASGKLPIANKPTEQPINENTNETANETANWKTYTSIGVSVSYPNDGTYAVVMILI